MAQQTINIGTTANDGTGDPLRTAFDKVNSNFTELYNDESQGEVNSIIAGDGISVDTATGNVTVTNTITNNNQLTNGAGYVDGSGTANKLPKFTDSDTIGNSIVTDNGTGVGINNSNPTEILEVYRGADNSRLKIQNNAFASWVGNDATGFAIETNLFKPITFKPAGVTAMTLDSSGNVGIGTATPAYPLEIYDGASRVIRAGSSFVSIDSTGSEASPSLIFEGDADTGLFRPASNNLAFSVAGTERMRIKSFGDISFRDTSANEAFYWDASAASLGIGTTSPNTKLQIQDGSLLIETLASSNKPQIILGSAGANYGQIQNDSSGIWSLGYGAGYSSLGTSVLTWNSSGNVGIGTSSPTAPLSVTGGTTQARFEGSTQGSIAVRKAGTLGMSLYSNAAGTLGIFDNDANTERMRIDSSGNVGIGTSSPATKLHNVGTTLLGSGTWPTVTLGNSESRIGMLSTTDQVLAIANTNGTVGANNGGQIVIGATGTTGVANLALTSIEGRKTNATSGNYETYLKFSTSTSVGALTERMRIDSSGNVGINDNPSFILDVNSTSSRVRFKANTGNSDLELSSIAGRDWLVSSLTDGSFRIYDEDAASERMRITSGGEFRSKPIYDQTTAVAANVNVDGSTGAVRRSTSSLKYKTEVRDYDKGLDVIDTLRPVYYKGKTDGDKQFAGLIAEEVHDSGLEEFVQYAQDGSPDALAYTHLVALLVNGIKELRAEIEILKTK